MKATDVITVLLDGQPHPLPASTTLAELVAQLGHAPAGVTTALNGVFMPRGQRGDCVLAEADAVVMFKPIVGG